MLFLARTETWDKTSGISGVSTATAPSGISSSPLTDFATNIVGLEYDLFWTESNWSTTTTYPTASTGLMTCQLSQNVKDALISYVYWLEFNNMLYISKLRMITFSMTEAMKFILTFQDEQFAGELDQVD